MAKARSIKGGAMTNRYFCDGGGGGNGNEKGVPFSLDISGALDELDEYE